MQFASLLIATLIFAHFFPQDVEKVVKRVAKHVKSDVDLDDEDLTQHIRTASKAVVALLCFSFASTLVSSTRGLAQLGSDQSVLVTGSVADFYRVVERTGDFNSAESTIFLDETRSLVETGNRRCIASTAELDKKVDFFLVFFSETSKLDLELTQATDAINAAAKLVGSSLKQDGTVLFLYSEEAVLTEGVVRAAAFQMEQAMPYTVRMMAYKGMYDSSNSALDCIASHSPCGTNKRASREQHAITFLARNLFSISKGTVPPVPPKTPGSGGKQINRDRVVAVEPTKGGVLQSLVLFVTRLLCFLYPFYRTMQAHYLYDDEVFSWIKYWVLFAVVCIIEDLTVVRLPLLLFLAGVGAKMVMIAKAIYPTPALAAKAYDRIVAHLMENKVVLDRLVAEELAKGQPQTSSKQSTNQASNVAESEDSDSDYPVQETSEDSPIEDTAPTSGVIPVATSSELRRRRKR